MMNVVILGSNSFIARHFALSIIHKPGIKVAIFGRSTEPSIENSLTYINGDYTDKAALGAALKGQDIVYHFISASYPFNTWSDPAAEIHENILPFLNFIELCDAQKVKKIVFTSS